MNKEIMTLVNHKTKKSINNAIVVWTSESDVGGDLVLYSYGTPVCEISSSCFIKFTNNWDYSKTTIKYVKMFICDYTGRKLDITTDEIKEWIKSGHSDNDNYYNEPYDIIKESA